MGGISREMDAEAEWWRAKEEAFDMRLQEQTELAEANAATLAGEVWKRHGVDGFSMMTSQEFIAYCLQWMNE